MATRLRDMVKILSSPIRSAMTRGGGSCASSLAREIEGGDVLASAKRGFSSNDKASSSSGPLPKNENAPQPSSPKSTSESGILLLTGDEFQVSTDGIARSLYRLEQLCEGMPSPLEHPLPEKGMALEEIYDLAHARKTFFLRQIDSPSTTLASSSSPSSLSSSRLLDRFHFLTKQPTQLAPMGHCLSDPIEVQEIDHHHFHHGDIDDSEDISGGTTWEASICMALFCCVHPDLLRGNVIELGSGVGLGGILATLGPTLQQKHQTDRLIQSMTFTDANEEVLQHCRTNVYRALGTMPADVPVNVSKLDWNDAVMTNNCDATERDTSSRRSRKTYQTILACDCAYRFDDVPVLSRAMKTLLDPSSRDARIHVFGPYNRTAYHQLIHSLREELDLDVELEWIEIHRYRLKPGRKHWMNSSGDGEATNEYATKATAKFIHVSASYKQITSSQHRRNEASISDLD